MDVSSDGNSSPQAKTHISAPDTACLDVGSNSDPSQPVACRRSTRNRTKKSIGASQETPETSQSSDDQARQQSSEKYNLRLSSLVKRVQVERRQSTPPEPKSKTRPQPLSKYRRRTANARERMRMRDINEGFELLRNCLPEGDADSKPGKKEKLTKYAILSLALNYIHALRDVLGYAPGSSDSSGGSSSSQSGPSCSEESDLGSDAASMHASSISSSASSTSSDDTCSSPSPLSATDAKEYLSINNGTLAVRMDLMGGAGPRDLLPGLSLLGVRKDHVFAPPSPFPGTSFPRSPPPLALPDECIDFEHDGLCLDIPISLDDVMDIDL